MDVRRIPPRDWAVAVVLAAGIGLALSDALATISFEYLSRLASDAVANLGIVAGLKVLAGVLSFTDGIEEIIDRVLNLMLVVNGLVFLNLAMLHLSRVAAVKVLIVVGTVVFAVVRPLRRSAVAALTVLLMVNPGLSLYTLLVRDLFSAAQVETSRSISTRLQHLRSMAEQEFQIAFSTATDGAAVSAPSSPVPRRSIRNEKNVIESVGEALDQGRRYVEGTARMVKAVAGAGMQHLLDTAVQYFVLAALQFIVMPALYLFGFRLALKRLFGAVEEEILRDRRGGERADRGVVS
jgi:hypothetical protein